MADQDLRIKVSAETGAAQDALGKLADEAAGLAKASEKAGSEQQKLARQVADTTSKVSAARDAIERAKRAQSEATAISAAFGSESREAAEALARVAAAQEAATAATRAAEQAVKSSADAVSELGKTVDEKGAAAVRRLNDSLQRTGKDALKAADDLRALEARVVTLGQTKTETPAQREASKAAERAALAEAAAIKKVTESLETKVAIARESQDAAAEATARATRALQEHATVVVKFGRESEQAQKSLERLKIAQAEATNATEKADHALDSASRRLSQVGNTAGARAAHGLDQMEKELVQVSKAADKSAAELAKVEKEANKLGNSGKAFSDLAGMLGKAGGLLGGALLGSGLMGAVSSIREMADATMAFDTAMANIPFGLEGARKATKGLVNDADLAKAAAQGLALGVVQTEDEFNKLAEAGTKLGLKLGLGPSQALDNMMTALGRGSTEILDNLGIAMKASEAYERYAKSIGKSTDSLTEAEKKTAFKVEAIKTLTKAADETTVNLDTAAASVKRFGVAMDNTQSTIEGGVVEVAGAVADALPVTDNWYQRMGKLGEDAAKRSENFQAETIAVKAQTEAQAAYLRELGVSIDRGETWNHLTVAQRENLELVGQRAYENANTLGTLDGELLQHWETVKGFTESLWGEAEAYAQATQAARNHAEAQKAAEDERWQRLEARNRKLEEQAIEEEFVKANEMGPALPPGFKRHEKKAKKPKDLRMIRHEFNAEVENFAFETGKQIREADAAAAAAAVDAESKAREENIKLLEEEAKAFEAAAEARNVEVDAIFFTLNVKSEAAMRADELRDEQLRKEEQHVRWLQKNAKTDEQREKAQTKIMEVENKKRLLSIQRTLDEEARIQAKRQKVMEVVTGAVTTLGEGMVTAFEAMAKGEEGAVAKMLSDVLKGVAKKHAVLSLAEFALAAGSAASYNFPAAAAHAAAGGMHAGVAVAAGVGAVAAGKVWEARRGDGESSGSGGGGGSSGSGGKGSSSPFGPVSGSDPGAKGEDGLEAQQVPISHEQLRRQDATVRRNSAVGGPTVQISGTVNIYGAGGKREFIEEIRRGIEQSERGGKRARI